MICWNKEVRQEICFIELNSIKPSSIRLDGSLVYDTTAENGENWMQLNLDKGAYFIKMISESGTLQKTLIIN